MKKIKDFESFGIALIMLGLHIMIITLTMVRYIGIGLKTAIIVVSLIPALGFILFFLRSIEILKWGKQEEDEESNDDYLENDQN